eukprot:8637915-Ditylum_brightwellii.AAC.1
MDKFCLVMDNYYTLPQVVKYLRDNGIGVVETARMRKGWPPTGLHKFQAKHCNFNDFRYLIDEHRTLVAQ